MTQSKRKKKKEDEITITDFSKDVMYFTIFISSGKTLKTLVLFIYFCNRNFIYMSI